MNTHQRAAGVLLHPSSLPGAGGHGDFGPDAYHFIDWLVAAGQTLWQILPLSPPGSGNSPYMSVSTMAGNSALISPQQLLADGLLSEHALDSVQLLDRHALHRVDFAAALRTRNLCLRQAYSSFCERDDGKPALREEFDRWCAGNQSWAPDYALFMALAESGLGPQWHCWPADLRNRETQALQAARQTHKTQIEYWLFVQWQFDRQWLAVKRYANERGVAIVGDMPIYCAFDSADVWQFPQLFQLDGQGQPLAVAGVPPDYFSSDGQLWGNPLYNWPAHEAQDFAWWTARMRRALQHADLVRIDHFRGLAAYWAVPADASTAKTGQWQAAPGRALFTALQRAFNDLPIIAEDLGTITPDVHELRDAIGLPGMAVLQFAFGDGSGNAYLPHNLQRNTVVYTGTHDNDTSLGWFAQAAESVRRHVQVYLKTDGQQVHWDLIHAASSSVANLAVYPMQDVLGLGSESRMNAPGQAHDQWGWRFDWSQVQAWHAQRLREISVSHGRAATSAAD